MAVKTASSPATAAEAATMDAMANIKILFALKCYFHKICTRFTKNRKWQKN